MTTLLYSFQYQKNAAMKVFSRLFVGVQSRSGKDVPLAFATPYEENAAGRKRQETVMNWLGGAFEYVTDPATGRYKSDGNGGIERQPATRDTRIIENVPAEGFKITDDIKRVYWGGGNVVWRIEDPRGFELEIQSSNLMAIIQVAGLEQGGRIPGKCVWGRSGGDNILLHETSEEYKDSIKAAETLKAPKQVGKAARQVGGVYRLVDGTCAIFLGKVHVCRTQYPDDQNHGNMSYTFAAPEGYVPTQQNSGRIGFESRLRLELTLNWSRYSLEPSVEFEAVLPVTSDGAKTGTILLYKKAPLVDYISAYPDVTVNNVFLDSFDWRFASTSITCARITSVTVDPILNPVIKLLPWSDAQYDKRRADLENRGRNQYNHWEPGASTILTYKGEEVAVIGDKLYGHFGCAGRWSDHKDAKKKRHVQFFATPTIIGAGCYTTVMNTNDSEQIFSEDQFYFGGRHLGGRGHGVYDPAPADVLMIPYMADTKELLAYYDSLRNDRALFTLVTREA